MMYITDRGYRCRMWHVGEPFPEVHGAVVTFQADCHELEWLLEAIQAHLNVPPTSLAHIYNAHGENPYEET
jgi:hypothetical protein